MKITQFESKEKSRGNVLLSVTHIL